MRRDRGLTLIEGLFSLLLVMLILGALAKTLVNAGKVRSNRENMDRAVDELHLLQSMRADITNSLQVNEPLAGQSGPALRLLMVDPELSFAERIDPIQGPELPFESSEQVQVAYRIEEGVLRRVVTTATGASRPLSLLAASGFEAGREGTLLSLKLDFLYSRVEKSRTLMVDLR